MTTYPSALITTSYGIGATTDDDPYTPIIQPAIPTFEPIHVDPPLPPFGVQVQSDGSVRIPQEELRGLLNQLHEKDQEIAALKAKLARIEAAMK